MCTFGCRAGRLSSDVEPLAVHTFLPAAVFTVIGEPFLERNDCAAT